MQSQPLWKSASESSCAKNWRTQKRVDQNLLLAEGLHIQVTGRVVWHEEEVCLGKRKYVVCEHRCISLAQI